MTTISCRQRARTITKLALIATATVAAACAHTTAPTTAPTTEMPKTSPATTLPTPGRGAVTFEYLQRAPVPALCEHDPGQLKNGQLPKQEGHPGTGDTALDNNTAP